jgi:hypothetical protein
MGNFYEFLEILKKENGGFFGASQHRVISTLSDFLVFVLFLL